MEQDCNSEDRFVELISICDVSIDEIAKEAKMLIDNYYSWWSPSNKEVLNLRSLGEDVNTGVIAPHIRRHHLNKKVYITWVLWPRKSLERRLKSTGTYSQQIIPLKRGYSFEQLAKNCEPWEEETVKKTEVQLSVLRESLDLLHQTKVNLNRFLKKLNKNKQN